jgi:hypothetical protein
MVASPDSLGRYGRPKNPADLPNFETVASADDIFDGGARWNLTNPDNRTQHIELKPRLITSDLRVRLQAAIRGIGIAIAAGTGDFPTPEGAARRTSAAGMVRGEEYSPSGLSDATGNAAIGQKSY